MILPPTTYAALLRYVLWAVAVGLTIALIWKGVNIIHDNGRAVERGICIAKINDLQKAEAAEDIAREKEHARQLKEVAKKNEEQLKHLMEVLSDRQKEYDALAKRRAADTGGLYINAKSSSSCVNTLPRSSDPGEVNGSEERIRLPEDVERRLRDVAYTAQKVVIDHNKLLERCSKGAVIIGDKDATVQQ